MESLLKVLAGVAAVYVILVSIIWAGQMRMAFPAPRAPLPSLPGAEPIEFESSDGTKLRGLFFAPQSAGPSPAILWFYGNAENAAALAGLVAALRPPGVAVFLPDYRGYGASDGRPQERAMYQDATDALRWLVARPEVDAGAIIVYGRSLGSAFAAHVAVRETVAGVVLDAPFTSARDLARRHYPWVPRMGLRLSLETLRSVRQISVPVLVLHGSEDTIVPTDMGRSVAAAAPNARFVEIPRAGHNDTYMLALELYRTTLAEFVAAVTQP